MIRVINLKPIIGIICIVVFGFILCFSFNYIAKASKDSKYFKYTIVLDAGHGGFDGGCVGKTTNVTEAELNLEVTKLLAEYLKDFGFNVVLTRSGKDALGKDKVADMEKRKGIINRVNPIMVVSIHMNSFTDPSESGVQTFYKENNVESQALAQSIQAQLQLSIENARESANHGDYYILDCSNATSCIVECGFLSNPNDEKLLNNKDYKKNLAYGIYSGIVKYLITSSANLLDQ